MTALADGPGTTATHVLQVSVPARDVPTRVAGTHLYGCQPDSGYVVPPSLVRRVDGQVLQLTPLLYAVLEAVDGARTLDQIANVVTAETDRYVTADDVRFLVDTQLRPLGLVAGEDGSHPPLRRANPLLALRPRIVVSKPQWTRRLTAPFAALFHPVIAVPATIAFVAVAGWVLFAKGLASAAHEALTSPSMLLAVFAVTVVSAGFHEFGHAAGLRRSGGTPGAMGAGLYLVWPAFYTDVTDSYRLGRRARLRTDLGGLYFNALVALATFALWVGVRWDGLLLVIAAQILQMIRQLPPLVRFDGYHILADITGVPDLFHRIGPTLRSFLPRRWRPADARELKLWARIVVTAWVLLVVPILAATAVLTVIALPRMLGTTAHAISAQAHLLHGCVSAGDWAGAGAKALGIAALAVPVAGVLLMLVRMARRYVVAMWRRTSGRPLHRAVAAAALVAAGAGLAYAWWPHPGTYQPIAPGEHGTLQDGITQAMRVAHAPVAVAQPAAVPPPLAAGAVRSATTLWGPSYGRVPSTAHKQLAMVLVPRTSTTADGSPAPTWVFPFARPQAPGPGDNQALAVVTQDGGTAYDVAFALVWSDQDTVTNTNSAYALASCRQCQAVAVSFQVVLVVGQADVVAPQNVAAAVAYHCPGCVTSAIAEQLVLTVPGEPTAAERRQITVLWRQIQRFSRHLDRLTPDEIRARLADYERQIVAIVRPETATPEPSTSSSSDPGLATAPTPASTRSPATAAASAGTQSDPSATSTTDATESPSDSASPSASPSESPSASPSSDSPTPSPSSDSPTPSNSASPSASPSSSG